jgi:DNA-binding NtrC family response regulator
MTALSDQSQTILIVDDEQLVLNALQETLEREKYHVVTCTSPLKALAMLEERSFAVIISDQRMPEMQGLDFLIECRRMHPHASRVLITAVLSLPTIVAAVNRGEIFRFVAKPWLREELLATVRNAIQRHDLIAHNEELQATTQALNAELLAANTELELVTPAIPITRMRRTPPTDKSARRALRLPIRFSSAWAGLLGSSDMGRIVRGLGDAVKFLD